MENVYVIAILATAIVIIVVVVLLRSRITAGRLGVSAAEKKLEAEFTAELPKPEPASAVKSADIEIANNWMLGKNVVRVFRSGVRIIRNKLLGQQRLEVGAEKKITLPVEQKGKQGKRK